MSEDAASRGTQEAPARAAVGRVGFVGLGSVGEPMAANALRAGFETVVFDPRRGPVERLAEQGALVAASVSDLASRCQTVQIMVATDAQLGSVVEGLQAGGLASGAHVLVHSTVHPDTIREVGTRLVTQGIHTLDAPVSGPDGAEAGARSQDMTFMVGGSEQALARVRPLLEVSGRRIYHLGPELGAGQLAKLAANAMTMVSMESTRQALRFAERAGLDREVALELWRHTSGNSWAVEHWVAMHELAARHPGGGSGLSALGYKDLSHFLDLAHRFGIPMTLAALASQLLDAHFGEAGGPASGASRPPPVPPTAGPTLGSAS